MTDLFQPHDRLFKAPGLSSRDLWCFAAGVLPKGIVALLAFDESELMPYWRCS
ncbi:MAG: hypothetical protein G8237_04090 [Magnetococcales bacterium]|nr:hypothetical protein [Magnetococcales bacterium]